MGSEMCIRDSHHLLRDLVAAVVASGGGPMQGISVVAVGMRVVLELSLIHI